ncbi:MAG: hypothetical protein AAF316_00270 [Cyanobacteria bacterium P01_A01_bin.80]
MSFTERRRFEKWHVTKDLEKLIDRAMVSPVIVSSTTSQPKKYRIDHDTKSDGEYLYYISEARTGSSYIDATLDQETLLALHGFEYICRVQVCRRYLYERRFEYLNSDILLGFQPIIEQGFAGIEIPWKIKPRCVGVVDKNWKPAPLTEDKFFWNYVNGLLEHYLYKEWTDGGYKYSTNQGCALPRFDYVEKKETAIKKCLTLISQNLENLKNQYDALNQSLKQPMTKEEFDLKVNGIKSFLDQCSYESKEFSEQINRIHWSLVAEAMAHQSTRAEYYYDKENNYFYEWFKSNHLDDKGIFIGFSMVFLKLDEYLEYLGRLNNSRYLRALLPSELEEIEIRQKNELEIQNQLYKKQAEGREANQKLLKELARDWKVLSINTDTELHKGDWDVMVRTPEDKVYRGKLFVFFSNTGFEYSLHFDGYTRYYLPGEQNEYEIKIESIPFKIKKPAAIQKEKPCVHILEPENVESTFQNLLNELAENDNNVAAQLVIEEDIFEITQVDEDIRDELVAEIINHENTQVEKMRQHLKPKVWKKRIDIHAYLDRRQENLKWLIQIREQGKFPNLNM